MMAGSTLVDETDPAPGHIYTISMHGMTTPTGVFANDKDIRVTECDDDSDGPDEIDTGYFNEPELPVHPHFSATGGAGMRKSITFVLSLGMLIACTAAAPLSVSLSTGSGTYGSVVLPHSYFTGDAFQFEGVHATLDDATFHTCFADVIGENRISNQSDPVDTNHSNVSSAFPQLFSTVQNCTVECFVFAESSSTSESDCGDGYESSIDFNCICESALQSDFQSG
eukprot:gene18931-22621_t